MRISEEKLNQLAEKIANIPVSDIVETRIPITRQGSNSSAACPFCGDAPDERGHFKISDKLGIFHCFKCGMKGTGLWFIQKMDGIGRNKAILSIGREFGMITSEEAKELGSKKVQEQLDAKIRVNYQKRTKENEKSDKDTIDYVYNVFRKGQSLEHGNKPALSDEHRKYLNSRGIDDARIEENQYFSIPNLTSMGKLLKIIGRRGMTNIDLIGVPGFYYDTKKKKVSFFTSRKNKGIGIPIHDEDGKIVAIQIRRDEIKDKDMRYTWFSSSFLSTPEEGGVGPGAPIDVCLPPNGIKNETIYVTEGHFKADELARHYQAIALSVQGVGNWKDIQQTLNGLQKKYNVKRVCIAYDADMSENLTVLLQAYNLGKTLHHTYSDIAVTYAIWDEDYGKGIDDAILAGESDKIMVVPFLTFAQNYNQMLMDMMRKFNIIDKKDIPNAIAEHFSTKYKGNSDKQKKYTKKYVKKCFLHYVYETAVKETKD